ncbi:hypothetical protein EV122DRAFT_226741, partial [Schizophyllum commune]
PFAMADDTAWIQKQAKLLGYTNGDRGVSQEDVNALINNAQDDFEEPKLSPSMQEYAEELMRAYIKDTTRAGHVRIAKAYMAYHSALDPLFKPEEVSESTPLKIVQFITYKHGLPTRSQLVSKFMVGLEKTKAAAGEISNSARALTLQDMHRLFDLCVARTARASATIDVQRQGIVRYTAYLLAWLLVLRIDEAMSLTFESIDKIPGERKSLALLPCIRTKWRDRRLLRRSSWATKDPANRYRAQLETSCK